MYTKHFAPPAKKAQRVCWQQVAVFSTLYSTIYKQINYMHIHKNILFFCKGKSLSCSLEGFQTTRISYFTWNNIPYRGVKFLITEEALTVFLDGFTRFDAPRASWLWRSLLMGQNF